MTIDWNDVEASEPKEGIFVKTVRKKEEPSKKPIPTEKKKEPGK